MRRVLTRKHLSGLHLLSFTTNDSVPGMRISHDSEQSVLLQKRNLHDPGAQSELYRLRNRSKLVPESLCRKSAGVKKPDD